MLILVLLLLLSGCVQPVDTICMGGVKPNGMLYLDCGTKESWDRWFEDNHIPAELRDIRRI